jgi:hypothetical protein
VPVNENPVDGWIWRIETLPGGVRGHPGSTGGIFRAPVHPREHRRSVSARFVLDQRGDSGALRPVRAEHASQQRADREKQDDRNRDRDDVDPAHRRAR